MKTKYWLLMIIVISAILRLWQLGKVPPSPDWDEAALGYNAYSILRTGRDEFGSWMPLTIRSFDDYKPPLYVYLTIPSVAVFGLNVWAVRLPSVIMGILAVAGVFFLTKELFKSQISKLNDQQGKGLEVISLVSAGLLAISPWHIQFSRIAFEANSGITLNIWAAYWFLRGMRRPEFLILSAGGFGLALYAYHSERVFAPGLVVLLGLVNWSEIKKLGKKVLPAIIVGLIVVAPLVPVMTNPTTLTRLRGTSSLTDQTRLLEPSVKRLQVAKQNGNILGQIVNNRRLIYLKTLADGYLAHFSLRWLFVTGDSPRHHAPDMGLLYIFEVPFLLWGMVEIFRLKGKLRVLLFGWLLLAPVAGAPTTGVPHAIRTLVFLPVWQWFTAVGFVSAVMWLKKQASWYKLGLSVFVMTGILFFVQYLSLYFGHLNRETSFDWQYGYEQAVNYARVHYDEYDKIVVSTSLEQPHMFFLFYLQYPPEKYLAEGGTKSGGFAESENKFDKYEFRRINWDLEEKSERILYIGKPDELPGEGDESIYYLNGEKAMEIRHG